MATPIVPLVATRPLRLGASGPAVVALQNALRRSGAELVVDGGFGRVTLLAVERFQAAYRIAADGEVGPITAAYLDAIKGDDPPAALPSALNLTPWLSYMRALTGTKEIPGGRSNPLILSWVRSLGSRYPRLRPNIAWYVNDDTPWCGLGCAEVVGECDPGFEPPEAPLGAINWASWGRQLDAPALGAILVFRRTGGNHVSLYEGEDKTHFHIRGANQSNMINVVRKEKSELVRGGIRWPNGYPLPTTGAVKKSANGTISTNEA